jgi:hypothetical protein
MPKCFEMWFKWIFFKDYIIIKPLQKDFKQKIVDSYCAIVLKWKFSSFTRKSIKRGLFLTMEKVNINVIFKWIWNNVVYVRSCLFARPWLRVKPYVWFMVCLVTN